MPSIAGKLEVNIKISELPNNVRSVKHDWKEFVINADGQLVKIRIRPRIWNKLKSIADQTPQWTASITGRMGTRIKDGFELEEPAVQIFEKKAKPDEKVLKEDNSNEAQSESQEPSASE